MRALNSMENFDLLDMDIKKPLLAFYVLLSSWTSFKALLLKTAMAAVTVMIQSASHRPLQTGKKSSEALRESMNTLFAMLKNSKLAGGGK